MQLSNYAGAKAQWKVLGLLILGVLGASVVSAAPRPAAAGSAAAAAAQAETDVSPEATPEIRQVKPNQAAPGEEVTLTIDGRSFARGVYVSFTNPAVHVVSTRRISATQLEAKLAVESKAAAGTVSLYVSNPASPVAETPFTIAGAASPAAPPPAPAPAPVPKGEIEPSEASTPEVAAVDPPRAAPGSEVALKVTGKNFAPGVKVAFSNPGIRVLETNMTKSTELVTRLQVAPDAATGTSSLFVVNPGGLEVEVPFEVAGGSPGTPAAPEPSPATTSTTTPTATPTASSAAQQFQVYNLGEVASIFQSPNKPTGTLAVAGGKLSYQEKDKEVFSVALGDIKEIDVNTILGVNTGTFHVILNSGKTYNFVAASLRPADSQQIVDSLRKVLH